MEIYEYFIMPTLSSFNTNGLHINMYLNDSLISVNNFISMIKNAMFLRNATKIRCCNTKFETIYSWYTVYVNFPTYYCLRFNSEFSWSNFFDIIHKKLHKRETKQYTSKKAKGNVQSSKTGSLYIKG